MFSDITSFLLSGDITSLENISINIIIYY